MPQLNRDQETLYSTERLHRVFFVASALLVLAIGWMLVGDYVRPWKGTQTEYFRRQAGLLELEREQAERAVRGAEQSAAALQEVGRKIAAEERRLAEPALVAERARLQADLDERRARVVEAETQTKAVKGAYAERRFAYEMAMKAGDEARSAGLAAQVNDLAGQQDHWESKRLEALAEQDALDARLSAASGDLRALKAERDRLLADVAKAELAAKDARSRTESDQWRNLPLADIVAPSIKIEKVVLENIHDDYNFTTAPKVDMCMTCHRGIDAEIASEPKVRDLLEGYLRSRLGEKAWERLEADPAWVEGWAARTAPGRLRPWLSGAPRLTDLVAADRLEAAFADAETAAKWRERVLAGKSFEEGGADLLAPLRLAPVDWAHPHLDVMVGSASHHPMESFGCTTCHQGVGRRLDFVRAAHTPNSHEQEEEWRRVHGWKEPEFIDFPMIPARHVQGQCLKCHQPTLELPPVPEPLIRWTEKTGSDGKTERVRATAPKPVDAPDYATVDGRWRPETLEWGVTLMREQGCTACHQIRDFGVHTGFPRPSGPDRGPDFATPAPGAQTAYGEPKVGPDLSHLRDKTTKAFAARWIENPTSLRPDTRMPAFYRHRVHDDRWVPTMGADGKPQDLTVVVEPDARDLAQIDVEVLALATFLVEGQTKSRAASYAKPPEGDVERGRKTFYSVGCYACHLGPDDRPGSGLPEATLRRFERRRDLPPGPRLDAVGGKLDPAWLYAWLEEPRHYNSVTRMPNLRWQDETAADGKTVVRTAAQVRADVVAYLMAHRDAAFDATPIPDPAKGVRWTKEHERLLKDFWVEWYGKSKPDAQDPARKITMTVPEAAGRAEKLWSEDPNRMLIDVGRRLVGYRGCFGCHNVEGYENEQPIGKELTEEGSQDIHKFDFGLLDHHEVPHTRWDWIENKLRSPRIFDRGRFKPRWTDKLRMPKFNLREQDRQAITAVVLGLVRDPVQPDALYRPTERLRKVAAGRAVVERYGCNQCHTVENRLGVLTAEQLDRSMELWMLPPNLHGQGNRTKPDWLFGFLKTPFNVRPGVVQRMPMFRLSDEEVVALVDYFAVVADRADRYATDPEDKPLDATPYPAPVTISVTVKDEAGNESSRDVVVRNQVEEARALFDTLNCVKCHLPKGTPGADPNEGASAPPFTLARARLQRAWMRDMVRDPQYQIQGTKMPSFWQPKSRRARKPGDSFTFTYPQFLVGTRGHEGATRDDVAEAQMGAVVRYILWHYGTSDHVPPAEPPAAAGK